MGWSLFEMAPVVKMVLNTCTNIRFSVQAGLNSFNPAQLTKSCLNSGTYVKLVFLIIYYINVERKIP